VDIEKFVSHFSKTMGEEMERRTQNDEGDICIMDPIMGPQAVNRIYSQEDINGDLNYLNKRISEGEVTEVVKTFQIPNPHLILFLLTCLNTLGCMMKKGKIMRISSYPGSCVVCLIGFFMTE
jgi:hypothetical protein